MSRLFAVAAVALALQFAASSASAASPYCRPHHRAYHSGYGYGNGYIVGPGRLVPGYEYQLRRDTARTAMGYTMLFGI